MRFLIKILVLLTVIALSLAAAGLWWVSRPLSLNAPVVDFRILSGSGLRTAVQQMREAGVDLDPTLFSLLAKVQRADTGLKAGSYSISQGVTPFDLLQKLTRGEVTLGEIALVEGLTFRQWRQRMSLHPDLKHDARDLSESEIAARLGIAAGHVEGQLFPDTYLFDKQSSELELLARAHRALKKRLQDQWAARPANLPYRNPQEALIMASIVEKETGRPADRPQVAAVFVNRLRLGMRLQTDPTVIYGLGERFDGNLRKQDLLSDTPYNTYTRNGLPPTPIAMFGAASLQAALNPAASDALYFVARGDGSSQFSRTLDEHNRAVNLYQRGVQ